MLLFSLSDINKLFQNSLSRFSTPKGLTNPVQPSGLSAIVLGFSSARIEWTVPSISYTQETHSVVYGLSQQQLDSSSTAVAGTSDLRAVNQVYSTNLTNLEEGRTYYYRVQSMNTVGRVSQSDIGSFQVEDSRKYFYHVLFVASLNKLYIVSSLRILSVVCLPVASVQWKNNSGPVEAIYMQFIQPKLNLFWELNTIS